MSRTGFWVDSQRVMHSYTNEAPFCLTPTNTSTSLLPSFPRLKVEVVDWNDAVRVDLDTGMTTQRQTTHIRSFILISPQFMIISRVLRAALEGKRYIISEFLELNKLLTIIKLG